MIENCIISHFTLTKGLSVIWIRYSQAFHFFYSYLYYSGHNTCDIPCRCHNSQGQNHLFLCQQSVSTIYSLLKVPNSLVNYTNFVTKEACLSNTGIPACPSCLEYRLVDNIEINVVCCVGRVEIQIEI